MTCQASADGLGQILAIPGSPAALINSYSSLNDPSRWVKENHLQKESALKCFENWSIALFAGLFGGQSRMKISDDEKCLTRRMSHVLLLWCFVPAIAITLFFQDKVIWSSNACSHAVLFANADLIWSSISHSMFSNSRWKAFASYDCLLRPIKSTILSWHIITHDCPFNFLRYLVQIKLDSFWTATENFLEDRLIDLWSALHEDSDCRT